MDYVKANIKSSYFYVNFSGCMFTRLRTLP